MMQNNSITPMTGTEMLVPTATVGTQPSVNTPTPMGVGTPVSLFVAANSNASSADQSPVTVGCGQVVNTKSSANNKQQNKNNAATTDSGVAGGMCDEKTVEYLRDLIAEKRTIENNNINTSGDPENCTTAKSIVLRLLEQEIARIQSGGKPPGRDSKFVDIYHEKPIRLTVRALVPVKEHPKFNFVGKLLGPKGNSMKRLQEDTMTKMAVLGRGSMRNKQQEEELRKSSDPKYQHLNDDLHVEITAFAPPSEAHARIAYALTEVRKYLIPDSNDEIRQEQMREMELLNVANSNETSPASATASVATSTSTNNVSNNDGHDDIVTSDENGSTSPFSAPGSTSSPSPPSSTLIAMRGMSTHRSNGRVSSGRIHFNPMGGGGSAQTLSSQQQQRGTSSTSNSGSGNGSKYLRGHLFTNQGATHTQTSSNSLGGGTSSSSSNSNNNNCNSSSSNRPNTSKVRVLSILDKIRANTTLQQDNYASSGRPVISTPQNIPTTSNRDALIDAISLVEDNGFAFEEYETNPVNIKGLKPSNLDRGRYRMHIAPYTRPK